MLLCLTTRSITPIHSRPIHSLRVQASLRRQANDVRVIQRAVIDDGFSDPCRLVRQVKKISRLDKAPGFGNDPCQLAGR